MRIWLAAGVAVAAAVLVASAQGTTRGESSTFAAASGFPTISAPADMIVGEADGTIDLVVTLSETSSSPVSVHYTTFSISAVSGQPVCNNDFVGTSGTLTIPAGQSTGDVPVSILDCANVEGFETFGFILSSPSGGTIGHESTQIGIVDNDTLAATPRLFVRDAVVDEADGTAHVSVLLGGPAGQASTSSVTVDYATTNGTATAGSDYVGGSGTLTFDAGDTAKTIDVPITNDNAPEPAERFTISLSNASNATIADATANVVIGANDGAGSALPSISAPPDAIIGEGDGFVDLVVSLSAPPVNTVSVDVDTNETSAVTGQPICNNDFVNVSPHLTFAAGETTKVVRVQILDCANDEGFESFTFEITSATGAGVARSFARIGIVDNDNVVATPHLFARNAVVDEKDGIARVPVLLGGPGGEVSTSTVTVDYATSAHTASAGSDYTTSTGTLRFAPGETAKTIDVPISDDGVPEPPEDFLVSLSNPSNATLGRGTAVVVIGGSAADGSSLPDVSTSPNLIAGERDGFVDVVVSLAAPGLNPLSVNFTTADASAFTGQPICNNDYIGTSGTLNFAPGETTKVVRVDILDCPVVEPLEFFNFTLKTPVGVNILRSTTRIDIVDNDVAPTLNSVTVTPSTPTTSVGGDLQFIATGNYSNGSTPNLTSQVTWSSSNPAAATVSAGGLAHPVFPGTAGITATAPLILALGPVTGSTVLTVDHQQTIAFEQPPNKLYLAPDFTVSPTSSSGLPVALAAMGNCTVSGTTVHITAVGSCTLTASQAGNANFNPAPDASRTFAIAKANQTITFGALAGKTVSDPDFTVSASASSGLGVSFTASPATVCTVAGSTVHLVGAGTCTVTAAQGGDSNYNVAPNASQPFTVTKGTQSITFGALPAKTYLDPDFTVSATASSGLTISFSATFDSNCTVSGTTVHIFGAGSCTITASQSGNASYNAATAVSQTFAIAKANQAITINTHAPSTANGGSSFSVSASAPGGSLTYSSSGACTNSGSFFTTSSGGGTCTVTYDQTGSTNYNAAPQVAEAVTVSVTVQKQNQTITFAALANKTFGDPDFALSASASSGLAVSYTASGNCTVSSSTVHLTGPGSCAITAAQAGNASFNAAPPVSRSFTVQSPPPPPGCTVPSVVGKTLAAAKAAIAANGCKTGKVKQGYAAKKKKGVVLSQSRAGGTAVAAGTAIDLVVNSGTISATSCKTPKVVGKKLAAAKTALKKAHCRTGTVRQAYSKTRKTGVVISQSRTAGKVLATNTKINLVVSKGRAPSAGARLPAFVDQVEKVLARSAASRRTLASVLTDGFSCASPPGSVAKRLASVAVSRRALLAQLAGFAPPTAAASNALQFLRAAFRQSIAADGYYRSGFLTLAASDTGCPLPRIASFKAAGKADARATALKKQFVAAFNPLAKRFHRATWSATRI